MAFIDWHEDYSVEVKQFDEQHKKLLALINQLHAAMKEGKSREVMGEILNSLATYTETHFAAEEKLMKAHAYGGFEDHKKQHNLLVVQVKNLQQQYIDGRMPVSPEVLNFLRNWLQEHIQGTDRTYSPFFKNKGIV